MLNATASEYWPGGAGLDRVENHQIKAKSYGFDGYFEPIIVSDSIIRRLSLKNAIVEKKVILFVLLTPNGIHFYL